LSERLTDLVRKDEFTISVNNDQQLEFPVETNFRVNLEPLTNAVIPPFAIVREISLGIPQSFPNPIKKQVPHTDYRILRKLSETNFQKSDNFQRTFVTSEFTHCKDLSSSGKKIFHMASTVNNSGTDSRNESTAKPDVASLIMPMMMELKGNRNASTRKKKAVVKNQATSFCYEVLLQAVDRLVVLSDMRGFYSRVTCYAISSCNAYITTLIVDHKDGKIRRHIDITRIAHENINKLWIIQTQYAIAYPKYYVFDDATAIIDALLDFKIQWNVCRVSCVALSSSRVYFVTIPDKNGNLALHSPDFAMKINFNMTRFDNEVKALQDIAAQYEYCNYNHYALAFYRRSDDGTSTKEVLKSESGAAYFTGLIQRQSPILLPGRNSSVEMEPTTSSIQAATATTWYLTCQQGDRTQPAGVLFLHVGEHSPSRRSDPEAMSAEKIQGDLIFCCLKTLAAGWFQADMRTDNVLYFKHLEKWFIIDYDLAVKAKAGDAMVKLKVGSSQARACGGTVEMLMRSRAVGDEMTVKWTITTEFEMLLKLCAAIPRN